jgi:hypothetical protein
VSFCLLSAIFIVVYADVTLVASSISIVFTVCNFYVLYIALWLQRIEHNYSGWCISLISSAHPGKCQVSSTSFRPQLLSCNCVSFHHPIIWCCIACSTESIKANTWKE